MGVGILLDVLAKVLLIQCIKFAENVALVAYVFTFIFQTTEGTTSYCTGLVQVGHRVSSAN